MSANMQSSDFKFERLPNSRELNTIGTISYQLTYPHDRVDSSDESHSHRSTLAETQYQPIQEIPQQWPLNPEGWHASPIFKVYGVFMHGLLTLSPILFLLLAFAAISVDGKPLSSKGDVVISAAKIAPSLFPILFAAIVGRLMRFSALWRAQKGSRLGLLEQLNGSQNFASAFERAIHFKGLDGVGVLIVVLWLLSPLGGQSSLRVLSISTSQGAYQSTVNYFNTENYTQTAFQGASALNWAWPTIAAIYQACLLAPNKVLSSSTDLWGNVKIPLMQSLSTYTGAADQDWIVVPESPIYSSLSGIMVSGLNDNTTANFTISPGYLNLTCDGPHQFTMSNGSDLYSQVRQWTGALTYHSNASELLFGNPNSPADSPDQKWSSFTVDTNWNYTDPTLTNQTDINLIYLSKDQDGLIFGYNCSVGYTHVDAWVDCDGLECQVTRIRPSRQNHDPPNVTPFNQGVITYYAILLSQFPWATGQQHSAVTSPTDWYISGNNMPYNPSYSSAEYFNVSGQQVSHRLGTLINTIWQTSMAQSSLVQPHLTMDYRDSAGLGYDAIPTTANMNASTDVYVVSKVWVSLTIIISFVMMFCGIAGAAFMYLSDVPDLLGYVSSLTKDNPYFHGPTGSDTLSGLERSRMLQDTVVQIGNVKPWEDTPYIALRSISQGEDKKLSRIDPRYRRIVPHLKMGREHTVH